MVIGLVECPSYHTKVIPMSPDNRCPSCQELVPSTETDVTNNHLQDTQPEPFLNKPASTHLHDKWSNGWRDSSGSPSKAHEFESKSYPSFDDGKMAHPEDHAQQLLAKAIKLEARGRYEESFRLYQQILNEFPRSEATKDAKTRFDNLRIDIEGEVGTRETAVPVSSETLSTIRKIAPAAANGQEARKSALDISRMAFVPSTRTRSNAYELICTNIERSTSVSVRVGIVICLGLVAYRAGAAGNLIISFWCTVFLLGWCSSLLREAVKIDFRVKQWFFILSILVIVHLGKYYGGDELLASSALALPVQAGATLVGAILFVFSREDCRNCYWVHSVQET